MPDSLQQQLQTALGTTYTIERELGGGGMSRVFVAHEVALDRDVVVKVLAPELAEGLSAERFAREIRLAAALQEPHIVAVLAAGATAEGLPYYTMPFVRGESLRARMALGRVPAGEGLRILRDVAQALAYAHGLGVVHRDIKPENVLLSSGTAVVTDFGIAKALQASKTSAPGGTLTQIGTSLGTPAYMAPEQAAADPATDHRADLYAWGVMAYELIAGRHPFAEKTSPQQLMAAHFGEVPASLTKSSAGIARPVVDLVMRCLEKDPARRPQSASEVVAVMDGAGTPDARPVTARPFVRAMAIAAVLVVVIVGWFALHSRSAGIATAEAAGPVMLAVLPFENAGSAEQAEFTDGLTDAVTAKLGALPTLAVIDRRSAAQYRKTTKPSTQIGRELGVRYLLAGVVRWAKDRNGNWRAQVTPTLVDAKSGTTRWTGDPVIITPDDPFTAQGEIATKVAQALRIVLRPADRAGLARRFTDNPEAFASYQRGLSILNMSRQDLSVPGQYRRMHAEFSRAVTLDSSFAEAWGELAMSSYLVANSTPGDGAAEAAMRATFDRALVHAAGQPRLLLALFFKRLVFDRDTTGGDTLVARAVAAAPNDVGVLRSGGGTLFSFFARYDTGYALVRRAATLDPRSSITLHRLARMAVQLRRWDDARRYADQITTLDSTDERGWTIRLEVGRALGDTVAMQRDLASMLAQVPNPGSSALSYMLSAGGGYPRRFLAMSPRELRVTTLLDTLAYLSWRAGGFIRLGDTPQSHAYVDSIRVLLLGRSFPRGFESLLLSIRAQAEATLGQRDAARRTLQQADAAARSVAQRADLYDVIPPIQRASIYAQLGDAAQAVRWLELSLADPAGGSTVRQFASDPWLRPLRGTAAFEKLLREHPQ